MSFLPNTVFVVGAGAGVDHAMPLGTDLADRISSGGDFRRGSLARREMLLSGDSDLFEYLHYRLPVPLRDGTIQAMRRIARGITTAESIDTFIHRFQGDQEIELAGKMLIAWYILAAERSSHLKVEQGSDGVLDQEATKQNWLRTFSAMLFSGFQKPDIGSLPSRVKIVCFNYDRCIERYLQDALKRGFELDWQDSYELVRQMTIVHPYGHLGNLPVAPTGWSDQHVPYGAGTDGLDLVSVAKRLRTFTEATEDGVAEKIRDLMTAADRVVTLGFAFHSPNVKLLTRSRHEGSNSIYASGIGLSDQEVTSLDEIVRAMLGHAEQARYETQTVNIEVKADCKRLLEVHRLNLLER